MPHKNNANAEAVATKPEYAREFRAYAHRGGGAEVTENSWEAIQHAVQLGYKYIETDLRLTRDGQLLLQHNDNLRQPWGRDWTVHEWDWYDIRELRAPDGARPLRLVDAIVDFPTAHFNIDAKCDRVVDPLIELLQEPEIASRVTVTAFSDRRLARIRKHTNAQTSLGPGEVARLVGAAFCHSSAQAFAVPGPQQQVIAAQVPVRKVVQIINRDFIATAHQLGLQVHAWTIDDPAEMRRLIDMGVDGIMTDQVSLLRDILAEKGMSLA